MAKQRKINTPFSPNSKPKKTRQGNSTNTKNSRPGPNGGNKKYKKPYRGQGK